MKKTVSRYSTPLEMKYHHNAAAICEGTTGTGGTGGRDVSVNEEDFDNNLQTGYIS